MSRVSYISRVKPNVHLVQCPVLYSCQNQEAREKKICMVAFTFAQHPVDFVSVLVG